MMAFVIFLCGCGNAAIKKSLRDSPANLPDSSLSDAHGKKYSSQDLKKDDLILVVTAPNFNSNFGVTRRWRRPCVAI